LVVHENANAGWQATVNGRALPALRVDGWQQGWLVPAGTSGRVTLRYAPDRLYRLSLLAGLLGVVLLLGLALLPEGRPGPHTSPDGAVGATAAGEPGPAAGPDTAQGTGPDRTADPDPDPGPDPDPDHGPDPDPDHGPDPH